MAAAGGGKIRSRRQHITSKPYAKSRQQQSGLISRVTDTVKSIVPSWLQKYFKNGDVEEGGGAREREEQNCQQPLPPNGSEEAPPSLDGRDSPEPSTSHAEPPGRASLNFQEYVLSRPPLSRSHLHFPPLDMSSPPPSRAATAASLLSQPSTSSAPGPFSTGFSLVKEIKDNLSQHEDDNISTTSGFSSRASDKDVPTSKTASLPQLWSPETDRTGSGPQLSQSALKKPAFNLSVFGTSSNATINSSLLGCSQLGDSPFYPGKTTYGGAAAARSARARPGTPYQAPVRRQIKAKPAGSQPCGVTSATARRILQSLERMSSPVADAKRIPAMASPVSAVMDSSALRASHLQPKKKRLESSLPPVQKLLVPASPSVSRSVTFRPTLTPGGGIRALDQTPRATSSRQSPQRAEATPLPSLSTSGSSGPSGAVYPLSSTPAPSGSGGGKMKRERSSARPNSRRPDDDEVPEVPDLPPISLPLSTAALPTFSFSSPLPPVRSSPVVATATPAKESPTDEDSSSSSAGFVAERAAAGAPSPACVPFTFSSPIVKATPESPPTFSSSAGYTFSAPVAKLGPPMSNGKLAKPTAVKPAETKSTEEEFEGPFKPAKVLKQGSVLDLLRAPGFSSPAGGASVSVEVPSQPPLSLKAPPGWSCDVCLVQNKSSDTRCVCCAAPKPDDSSTTAGVGAGAAAAAGAGLAAVFSRPAGTWDCDTCLVVNKSESVKCVACETAKPGTGLKPSLTLQAQAAPISLQKPPGAWECDTCMVQNKADQSACVACTSLKPGSGAAGPASAPAPGFGPERSRPAEGIWDCDVCLLQNKAADSACVACQAARPGASVEPKGSSSSSSSSSASGGFKFGVSSSDSSSSSSAGFKLGVQFGSSSQGPPKDSAGFKFGGLAGGFKFGLSSSETEQSKPPAVAAASGFTFGTGVFGSGPSGSESASSKGAFTFGLSKPEEKAPDASSSSSLTRQEKSDRTSDDTAGGSVFGRLGETPTPPGGAAEAEPAAPAFTFGKPEKKEAPPAFLFGSVAKDTEATAAPPSGAFSFSKPGASGEQTPPTFSFGKSADKSGAASSDAPKTTFTFGQSGADSAAPKQAFSFMASNPSGSAPSTSSTSGPPSVFGSSTLSSGPSTTSSSSSSSVLPIVFGGSAPITSSSSSVLPSVFGGSAPSPAPSTSSASITPNVFGGSAPSSAPSTTSSSSVLPSVFGGSAPSSTPSTSSASITPSVFGGSAPSSAPSTTSSSSVLPSVFGGSAPGPAAASSAAPSSFLFGAASASSSEAPPAKTFVFGSSEQQPAPAAPLSSASAPPPAAFIFGAPPPPPAAGAASSFSFGSAAPPAASSAAPPAAPPAFAFSSAPSGSFGATAAPSFGASFGAVFPGSAPAPASQTPAFGAKPATAAPVFGQQSNATSVFGGGAATGGGFQFGATSSSPGVFTFGAGVAQPPAPAPTPAAAPQAPAGGGFNFTQSPAFNMGSNKAFAASPAGQASIPGRKIKTAVRRRK